MLLVLANLSIKISLADLIASHSSRQRIYGNDNQNNSGEPSMP